MPDLLERGIRWLERMRGKHRTRPVTYVRGAFSAELPATIGKTVFELDTGRGVLEKTESRDFLLWTRDLVLDGDETLPRRGDRIREEADGLVYIYEVMAPGKEPAWRWSDDYRHTLRIHTKQIDREDA